MEVLENLHASIIKITQDLISEAIADGISTDLQIVLLDAHVDQNSYPDTDFIGIHNFSVQPDEGNLFINVGFGVSMLNDENLFRHMRMCSRVFDRMKGGSTFRAVYADSGNDLSFLRSTGNTALLPMLSSGTRQVQPIVVTFATGETS